ncbi:MAG: zinc ribbon domain-containing protein [Candidatus Omnitrophota bacterium]|nr:zinc ribbon domain-containing protein [Candidatus Omnitrophota bacterium]
MPTYEYECKSCGYTFEKSQSMTEAHLKKCPKCFKAVKRLIGSGSGIIFKGKGFYATDYRKGKPKEVTPSSCSSCQEAAKCPAIKNDKRNN